MNRVGLKAAAKQCISDSSAKPYKTTFIYIIIVYALNLVVNAVSQGSVFDAAFAEKMAEMDLMDMFEMGVFGAMSGRVLLVSAVNILSSLVLSVLAAGYSNYCLRLSRGTAKGFSDISEALGHTVKLIWLTIVINIYIILWSMLFIIPGIVAAYRYSMAYFAMMNDPNLTVSQALQVSKQITQGHKMELFILDLTFIGWNFLVTMTFGILSIWVMPYMETTKAHAFNWLMSLRYPPINNGCDDGDYQGPEII